MRSSTTDPHRRVWLLALSVVPILIRRDESLRAEFGPETPDGPVNQLRDTSSAARGRRFFDQAPKPTHPIS